MNDNPTGRLARRGRMPRRAPVLALLACTLAAGCGGEAQIPLPNAAVVAAAPAADAPAPPRITAPPQPLIVGDGATAVFNVRAEGRGPFAYQWQREGVEIAGARGPTLVLAAAQRADDGARFRVVIRGADGAAVSEPVRLGVEPAGLHAAFERIPGAL
jgi:ABC-type phosphate transport system substrate-binding protein